MIKNEPLEKYNLAENLLQDVLEKYKASAKQDSPYCNILYAIGRERDEAHVHSKIICFLLNTDSGADGNNGFLRIFLETIGVRPEYIENKWTVYRERDYSGSRIDFIIESKDFCAAVEMKIDAGDGQRQLERYDSVCRKKGKEYRIYYLTLDGRKPSRQSAGSMDKSRLSVISFRKEIVRWLQKCMETVETDTYQYSFLKQYLGAVRQISGLDEREVCMKDLITDAQTGKAAMLVISSLNDKIEEIKKVFFDKISVIIEEESGLETFSYENATETVIGSVEYKTKTYYFELCLEIDSDGQVCACLGFVDEDGNWILLSDMQSLSPKFYNKWIRKTEMLELPKSLRQAKRTKWFYIENTRGETLKFKKCNYSDSVLGLIDEMDIQTQFIAKSLVSRILLPLLE